MEAFVTGDVEPVRDFEAKGWRRCRSGTRRRTLPMWQVSVHDPDPAAKGPAKSVKVVLLDERQPVPPPALDGLPFRPVEFDGLTVTPYVAEGTGRPRVAYSIRARVMRAPAGRPAPKGSPAQSCGPGRRSISCATHGWAVGHDGVVLATTMAASPGPGSSTGARSMS